MSGQDTNWPKPTLSRQEAEAGPVAYRWQAEVGGWIYRTTPPTEAEAPDGFQTLYASPLPVEAGEPVGWQVTQFSPDGSRNAASVSLVRGALPDYYRIERWSKTGQKMWEVVPLYASPSVPEAKVVSGVTEEQIEAATNVLWDKYGARQNPFNSWSATKEIATAALSVVEPVHQEE